MSRLTTLGAAAVLAVATLLVSPRPGSAAPSGSYQDSCRNTRIQGMLLPDALLVAECRSRSGSWLTSSIEYKRCGGDIYNNNGRLACRSGSSYPLPAGSWRRSCTDYGMDASILEAYCRKQSGEIKFSRLDTRRCNLPVSNRNGVLTCGESSSGDSYPLPSGSWRQSCSRYTMAGPVLEAYCRKQSGEIKFSRLDVRRCNLPVSNGNGVLICGEIGSGNQGGNYGYPGGSWAQTCRDYDLDGAILEAYCRDGSGSYRFSQLDLRRCGRSVVNRDGALACGGTGPSFSRAADCARGGKTQYTCGD